MYDIKDEKIVIEIQELVQGIESVKNEMDVYCELVKQMFLSGSMKN